MVWRKWDKCMFCGLNRRKKNLTEVKIDGRIMPCCVDCKPIIIKTLISFESSRSMKKGLLSRIIGLWR